MRLIIAFSLMFSTLSYGAGVPTSYKVTPENAIELGFLVELNPTNQVSHHKIGVLKYPKIIDGLVAARVQTFLKDGVERIISVSSSDAFISDSSPSVLFSFHDDIYDMVICIQYGSNIKDRIRYHRSYCIKSLKSHLITSP